MWKKIRGNLQMALIIIMEFAIELLVMPMAIIGYIMVFIGGVLKMPLIWYIEKINVISNRKHDKLFLNKTKQADLQIAIIILIEFIMELVIVPMAIIGYIMVFVGKILKEPVDIILEAIGFDLKKVR